MQKTLLLLNSSLNIKKPLLKFDNIKIEYGEKRLISYSKGFNSLHKTEIYNKFNKVALIDNTTSKVQDIDSGLRNLLPKETAYLLGKHNKIGRKNKGAGMLDSLQRYSEFFKEYDYIFYFEPRLILENPEFIINTLNKEYNVFTLESEKRVRTGYFGSISRDLIEFVNSNSSDDLVKNNLHIELLMYEFYSDKNTLFLKDNISLWKNYLSNKYEKY